MELAIGVDVSAAKSIQRIIKKNYKARTKPLKKTLFARKRDPILKGIGTEQVQHMARASLFVKMYSTEKTSVALFLQTVPEGSVPSFVR